MGKRSPFPTGNLRRRATSTGPIYVCTIWLNEETKGALEESERLSHELYPGLTGPRYDDSIVLSSMLRRSIESRHSDLRETAIRQVNRFRRLAHDKLCRVAV